ncbi:MAG: pantoate--beta-alanine ligase [Rhodobacter sp.]|nr:pantoate--beta-alanine ligase [Rhodobacter sp.]
MAVVRSVSDLRRIVDVWRNQGARIALVPTMGAVHEGHLSLVSLARAHADRTITSIFVNPSQFAPGEDFEKYPRDEASDVQKLAAAGCDLLFAPAVAEMYRPGAATTITVGDVAELLDGLARPGHFSGVATIVAKLLIQASPDLAVFGEKDFQQLQVIRRLVCDLDLPVEILGAPTMREPDGLAMSSRNVYLNQAQREVAGRLNVILTTAARSLRDGDEVSDVERRAQEALFRAGFEGIDYLSVRDAGTLAELRDARRPARIFAAVRIGAVRLIDNIEV